MRVYGWVSVKERCADAKMELVCRGRHYESLPCRCVGPDVSQGMLSTLDQLLCSHVLERQSTEADRSPYDRALHVAIDSEFG